jgi:probable HAF family extracellular repeat protein
MQRFLGGLGSLVLVLAVAGPAQADYLYTTLDVPGAILTNANGINASGQIVGAYNASGDHGFLLSGGSYTTLDVTGTTSGTNANGINASGQIVGSYVDASSHVHGFLLKGGSYTTLDVPGSMATFAQGINASGQIVGSYDFGHGFLLSGDSYTPIDVPGETQTFAYGINDAGQIVGSSFAGRGQGFLLSGGFYTTLKYGANGINDAGQIVGSFGDAAGTHGYLATPQAVVPAPTGLALVATGALGLLARARIKKERACHEQRQAAF